MKEKLTPFLQTMAHLPSIEKQYKIQSALSNNSYNDPLMEEKHEVVKGLVHKYDNRALIKVSYLCAAHCRFCTRIRQIGNPEGTLDSSDIVEIVNYLKANPQIDDVILSGGDPLFTPKITMHLLNELRHIPSVKVIRIGTRLPFHSPAIFQSNTQKELLKTIASITETLPFYLLLHIEHPDELTPETEAVISQLRQTKATLLSQSVFLKGINDNFETLYALFKRLYHLGVIPYYLYHCDHVTGLESFACDKSLEIDISKQLRKALSGIACPLLVEDLEYSYGKIPLG